VGGRTENDRPAKSVNIPFYVFKGKLTVGLAFIVVWILNSFISIMVTLERHILTCPTTTTLTWSRGVNLDQE